MENEIFIVILEIQLFDHRNDIQQFVYPSKLEEMKIMVENETFHRYP